VVARLQMIIQDVVPVVDLQTVASTMIAVEDLKETIMSKINLTERKRSDQGASMMVAMFVEERGVRIRRGIHLTKATNRRMIPSQPKMQIAIKTTRRMTLLIEKMKKTKTSVGRVEARTGVKEKGRERDPEILTKTRTERKVIDAANAKMMTDAIDKKRRGKIRSLREAMRTKIEEIGSARKNRTEMVAGNVKNVADMTKILVIVSHLEVTTVPKSVQTETKEGAMAEVVIGIGLLRLPGGIMISMETLSWQIETEVVTEAETNVMNREIVDMGLALKTGDRRWEETAAQEMGLIGGLPWEEMVDQTIVPMIEGDNRSCTSATLMLI